MRAELVEAQLLCPFDKLREYFSRRCPAGRGHPALTDAPSSTTEHPDRER